MPVVVPRAERQVDEGLIPKIRYDGGAPIEAFGGGQAAAGVSQAVSKVAQVGEEIYKKEKEKALDTWTTGYYTQLAAEKQRLIYDPKSGLITKRGQDSFTAPDEYGKQFDTFADSLEANASGEQLAMAKRIRAKERLEFDGQIMRHVSKESMEFQDQTVAAGIKVAQSDAVLSFGDPAAVEDKIRIQEALQMQTASGKPPALVELEMRALRSGTQRAVIERMIDSGADLEAKAYYDKVKDQLTGTDIDDVDKNLSSGLLAGESQRKSDEIFKAAPSLGQALAEARNIEEPKLRDETTRRVKDLFAQKKLVEQDREEKLSINAYNILDQTGNVDKIPRSTWNSFTGSQRSALISYARAKSEGKDINTDIEEYYNLKTMASVPATKNDFLQLNLMNYRDKFANTEFKELINLQSSMRKGDGKAEVELDGYRTNSDIVLTSLREAGINPSAKPGTDDSKQVALFKREVDRRVMVRQNDTGKKVTNTEMQEIVDNLMTQGITEKGWFWDTKKRVFELQPGEAIEIDIEDVPAGEKAKIVEAFARKGKKPTEEMIINLYRRNVTGGALGSK